MGNPLIKARNFVFGCKAAFDLMRHPRVLGEIAAAREDKDSIGLDEAFGGSYGHQQRREAKQEEAQAASQHKAPRSASR